MVRYAPDAPSRANAGIGVMSSQDTIEHADRLLGGTPGGTHSRVA